MKKINTSSYFTYIIETKNNKFIRRYKRRGLHGYPRTIPLKNISQVLKDTDLLYPKFYRNRLKYIDEEFILGSNPVDKKEIIDAIIMYTSKMYKVDCNKIKKFIKWKNNSGYLEFQVRNLKEVLLNRNFEVFQENIEVLNGLIKKLDDNRKLSFIHGDIHLKNIIINDNGLYLIDWELSTYGDIAYELAMHFILMEYDDKEKEYFISRLCENLFFDKEKLINDINVYVEFEKIRRKLLRETSKK